VTVVTIVTTIDHAEVVQLSPAKQRSTNFFFQSHSSRAKIHLFDKLFFKDKLFYWSDITFTLILFESKFVTFLQNRQIRLTNGCISKSVVENITRPPKIESAGAKTPGYKKIEKKPLGGNREKCSSVERLMLTQGRQTQ